ncbi:hypothetical protein, partial [Escherichia coli]|uniref:hypothetical protein n=1 Tax=Escherichia coli TaxID=562 RepID=UPI001BC85054
WVERTIQMVNYRLISLALTHSPELLFSRSGPRLLRFRKHEKNPFQLSLAGNSCVIHMAA